MQWLHWTTVCKIMDPEPPTVQILVAITQSACKLFLTLIHLWPMEELLRLLLWLRQFSLPDRDSVPWREEGKKAKLHKRSFSFADFHCCQANNPPTCSARSLRGVGKILESAKNIAKEGGREGETETERSEEVAEAMYMYKHSSHSLSIKLQISRYTWAELVEVPPWHQHDQWAHFPTSGQYWEERQQAQNAISTHIFLVFLLRAHHPVF